MFLETLLKYGFSSSLHNLFYDLNYKFEFFSNYFILSNLLYSGTLLIYLKLFKAATGTPSIQFPSGILININNSDRTYNLKSFWELFLQTFLKYGFSSSLQNLLYDLNYKFEFFSNYFIFYFIQSFLLFHIYYLFLII